MLKRITAVTFLSGMMLFGAPHVAFADGRHGGRDDRRSEHHDNDRDRDRDDYRRHHGYDHDYYKRLAVDVVSDPGDPVALWMLSGELLAGNNSLTFESDFRLPELPPAE